MFPYIEMWVRISDSDSALFSLGFLRSTLAGMAFGMLLYLICHLIKRKGISRGITIFFLIINAVLAMIQSCSYLKFKTYYQLSYMFKMAGQTVGNFFGDIVQLFFVRIWLLILVLVPAVLYIYWRKRFTPQVKIKNRKAQVRKNRKSLKYAISFLLLFIAAIIFCRIGGDIQYYTYNFNATDAVAHYGMINTMRVDLLYSVFGTPKAQINIRTDEDMASADAGEAEEENTQAETEEADNTIYPENIGDIDWDYLIANDTDDTLLMMDTYFANQKATLQNKYTGMFEGKNLILITAEAFSPLCVDEERTPALYKLSHTGFVFNNFYQPDWNQSTTGGEYANMSGMIPMWVNGQPSLLAAEYNYMPLSPGWLFTDRGYNVTAWHNSDYDYYYRDETHPNMGYTRYYGLGNGLELESGYGFPASDLEMFEATLDDQIEEYVTNGTPFHTYYMTVSGHGDYSWENGMSARNRDVTDGLTGYTKIDAYLASNMELEYGMEYMLEELEKYGILEDTVIVLAADHYPYYLTDDCDKDYYALANGVTSFEPHMERYRNTLILWSGCLEETVEIDTYCTGVDILPTLLNLFGFDYDSRLFSGRDLLAKDVAVGTASSDMHMALFFDGSWITNAGTYDATTDTFTAHEGVTLKNEEQYIEDVSYIATMRCNMSSYIIQTDYFTHIY